MTHYSSITIAPEGPDYVSPDNIVLLGTSESGSAYVTPETFETVHKYIDAVMTTDDFEEWDYCETDTLESFTVWNSDGTALWTTPIAISYCYTNIAIETKPLVVDGVEYHIAAVAVLSTFDAFSDTYDEESEETIRTYIGSTLNKSTLAESTGEDNQFIATIPHIYGFTNPDPVPGGYAIFNTEYIVLIYKSEDEDIIQMIQPIYINQLE